MKNSFESIGNVPAFMACGGLIVGDYTIILHNSYMYYM